MAEQSGQRSGDTVLTTARTLAQAGDFAGAATLLQDLCRTTPTAAAWCLLGAIRGHQGQLAECIEALDAAVALDANLVDAHYNRAQAHMHLGRPHDAIAAYRDVVRLQPDHAAAWNNLGYALGKTGAWGEASHCHQRALLLRPGDPEILINLANAQAGAGRQVEAIESYQAAIRARPGYAEAHVNLIGLLQRVGRLDEAAQACDTAQSILPDDARLHVSRGQILQHRGEVIEAQLAFSRAAAADLHSARAYSAQAFNSNYFEQDPSRILALHVAWDTAIGAALRETPSWNCLPVSNRRLRVGYVSTDFYQHSVAYFLEPLLAAHDHNALEIWCYADVAYADAVTARLRRHADGWRDIAGWSPAAVAHAIRADAIDILVDLAGHTAPDLLPVFARKPAPIQVTWLGYPNTTGLRAMDYRLTDAWADPAGDADRYHVETLVRLPGGFLCYQPPGDAPLVTTVNRGRVLFGSFNNLSKIGEQVVSVWARVLRETPGSRLVIKNRGLRDAGTARRYRELFQHEGIGADRLELRPSVSSKSGHLGQYADVDICLDTFPYNGTTTTCEALWMGVPVVCLAGNRHAARVGVSLLSQLDLADLIAPGVDGYVRIAVALAADPARRTALRAGLRDRMRNSALCDGARFAREVEAAYRTMWDRWRARA